MIPVQTISALILLSLLWSIQITGAAYMLNGFWFQPLPPAGVLPEYVPVFRPQVNGPLYLIMIFSCIAIYTAGIHVWRVRGRPAELLQDMGPYLRALAVFTVLMTAAAYKTIIYDHSPQLAHMLFWSGAGLSVVISLFWQEIKKIQYALNIGLWPLTHIFYDGRLRDVLCAAALAAIVYVPDVKGLLALSFIGEQMHHLDYFVMSPGWAAANGKMPYADVMSQYGLGLPVVLARLAQWTGGFDYEPVMRLLIAGGVLYFIGVFYFLKMWLGQRFWAFTGALASFGVLMLHFGVSPLVWIYPSASPWRLCGDVVCLMLLASDIRAPRAWKPLWAGAWAGGAMYLMTSNGMALAAAYTAYVLWRFRGIWLKNAQFWCCLAMPPAVFFVLAALTVQGHAFDINFWQNMIAYIRYFSSAHAGGVMPIYESLKYRNFGVFALGMAIPLIYVTAVLYFLSRSGRRGDASRYVMPCLLGIYGLMQYTYFVVRSSQTGYCLSALAAVWIIAWICAEVSSQLRVRQQMIWKRVSLAAVLVMVLTNHNYMAYPNILNVSRNPYTDKRVIQLFPDRTGYFNHQVKGAKEDIKLPLNSSGQREEHILTENDFEDDAALRRNLDQGLAFERDAALIRGLIPDGKPAAVVSSFETRILIAAGRAPYFYHVPLIASQPMAVRMLPPDAAHSPHFLDDTMKQLQRNPPPYIFVQRILLTDGIPPAVRDTSKNIMALIDAIKKDYTPVQQGEYLVALQRKDIP